MSFRSDEKQIKTSKSFKLFNPQPPQWVVWRQKSHKDFNSSLDINDVPWTEQRAQKVIKKFSSRFWIGLALVKGSEYSGFHNKWYSNQQLQKIAIDFDEISGQFVWKLVGSKKDILKTVFFLSWNSQVCQILFPKL